MADKKTYLELQTELDELLTKLQSDIDIDRAIDLHQSAQKLITKMEAHLKAAKNKVEKIKLKE